MSDNQLQEIITRAVVGRSERTLTWCHKVTAGDMKQVLGVRVSKTSVQVETEEGQPLAELTLDCDLWCSNGEETKIIHTRCRCAQEVPVRLRGEVLGDMENRIILVGNPRSTGVRVEADSIYVDFEATVEVEVLARARLWIKAYEMDLSSSGEEWDLSAASSSDSSYSPYGSH